MVEATRSNDRQLGCDRCDRYDVRSMAATHKRRTALDMMRFRLAAIRGGVGQKPAATAALIAGLVALASCVPGVAHAQSAANVAVVINEASAASVRVGEYYVEQRGIPAPNIIRIRTSVEDGIDPNAYVATIETPIAAALARERLQDRILYLVLAKGVPLRISGSTGRDGTHASVDSELTLLYRRMNGRGVLTRGHVENPYYLGDRDVAGARPFTHRDHDIYLVSRLDGFTVDDVIALIDRASRPTRDGRIILDQRGGLANSLGIGGWSRRNGGSSPPDIPSAFFSSRPESQCGTSPRCWATTHGVRPIRKTGFAVTVWDSCPGPLPRRLGVPTHARCGSRPLSGVRRPTR